MLSYATRIEKDGDGFMASFRDVPEALTGGSTYDEALDMAKDALITAMEFYFEDGRQVPVPSTAHADEVMVDLPPSLAIKVLLLNEMLAQQVRPVELARRLHVERQEVTRLLKLSHATKIDSVAEALSALGKKLQLSLA